jgi:hypothetical protein
VTKLGAGISTAQILAGRMGFSFLQNFQPEGVVSLVSYSMGIKVISSKNKVAGV